MLLRPAFFLLFLKVTNSYRILSTTHLAESPHAVLEQRMSGLFCLLPENS